MQKSLLILLLFTSKTLFSQVNDNLKDGKFTNSPSDSENASLSFEYQKSLTPKRGDLVINEIFADPSPQIDLPGIEFVEILNTTSQPIILKNWKFSDDSRTVTFPDQVIRENEFIILCPKADTNEYKSQARTIGLSPWPMLNNTGDRLKLSSPESIIIDSVAYTDNWYRSTFKKQGGWTLERIDPLSNCAGIYNWAASIDISGGTPGKVNSVYQKDYDQIVLAADSLSQTSDSSLTVFFNKPLAVTSLLPEKFLLSPSGNLLSANVSDDLKQVHLVFNRFLPNTTYQLSVQRLSDCAGNSIASDAPPLSFTTQPEPPVPPLRPDTATLYITEIFADPSPEVGLPLEEFIEIHNPGKDTVDLAGWTLNDTSVKGKIDRGNILPGQYLILCATADTSVYQPFGKVAGLFPWPSLNNTSDQVTLKSHTGRLVDSVAYKDSWYKSTLKKQGGWTLERVDLKSGCTGFYGWAGSQDPRGGTPASMNSNNDDNSALRIDSVAILSDSTLIVFLNSIPDTTTLQPIYFNVNNSIGHPEKVTINQEDYTIVNLTFNSRFHEGETYLLTASIKNCTGGPIDPSNCTATFIIPEIQHREYPVVINEIFADPSPTIGLPECEFIELYNPTTYPISLSGMIYEDGSNIQYKFTSGTIEANGYIILCAAKDTVSLKPFGKVLGINPWPTLNNDKDLLIIKDNKGYELHRVSYNSSWYKNQEKQEGGYSLEMIDPSSNCSGIQNWTSSTDLSGGTPGKENSVLNRTSGPHPLGILSASIIDSMMITLTFNRAVDSLSASDKNNYIINNGINSPYSALPISPHFNMVALTFSTPIGRGKKYQLTASNIKDCRGNLIASNLNKAEFIYAERIEKGDILINEILFNPRSNGVDFVEIYNNSSKTLDLKELSLATSNEKDSLIQSGTISNSCFLFEPNQYLVLTTDPDNIKSEYLTENPQAFLKVSSLPSFNDDAGVVILESQGLRIDQFNYSDNMHFPLIKDTEGVSLERSSTRTPTNEAGNFRSAASAVGFATPGYQNSQYVEDKETWEAVELISKTFSPDNDGFEDALLLTYQFKEPGMIGNASIFNDQGVLIRKLTRNQLLAAKGILAWDGLNEVNEKAPVGIYLIYLEVFDLQGRVKRYRKNFVLAAKLD